MVDKDNKKGQNRAIPVISNLPYFGGKHVFLGGEGGGNKPWSPLPR